MNPSEARNHATFTALMWALSHPGRPQRLPESGLRAFDAIGHALIDLETSYFTPDAELAALLARTGARTLPAAQARYQFFPQLSAELLPTLEHVPIGTYAAPDEAATLLIGCTLGTGRRCLLRGPGIPTHTELRVDGLPPGFWELRARTIRYPLGWDVFLVAGDQVLGLPRTTVIE